MADYSRTELIAIAKYQKGILWCVLCNLLCFALPFAFLVVIPIQLYFVYKLSSSLKQGFPILWCIGIFIPLLSLIMLLILSQKATSALKEKGISVGLMGAKIADVEGVEI